MPYRYKVVEIEGRQGVYRYDDQIRRQSLVYVADLADLVDVWKLNQD